MRDIKETRPDDKQQTGGQSTIQSQEEIKNVANSIEFDDDSISVEDKEDSLEKLRIANEQVESELAQYYDDDITQEEIKAYLISKVSDIYGKKLEQCNILVDSLVEGFLDINEFNGVESYRKLTQIIEESIRTISKMRQDKGKGTEGTGLQALSEEEIQRIISAYRSMSNQGELSANAYISSQAKKLGVDKRKLTSFILEKGKAEISSPNKVLHYHRTSMQSFKQIMQTGYLLNRKNMQLNGIDISGLRGSSSANIQFSRDIYNNDGKLQIPGFDIDDNLGANSADVVFVLSPELMKEDTYNCLGMYPTVEKADVRRCCAIILAKDLNIKMQIENILKDKKLPIRTILQKEFDRETILEELNKNDIGKQSEETGIILKSVNGRDILSSAIEATEEKTRTSTINRQVRDIKTIKREQTQENYLV